MGVDFPDVASGRRWPLVHPGQILRDEFLEPTGLGVHRLARDIQVPRLRLNEIVLGRRADAVDTTLRLARYFGTTREFWISLQSRCDLDVSGLTGDGHGRHVTAQAGQCGTSGLLIVSLGGRAAGHASGTRRAGPQPARTWPA
ncbi:MAG: HigA family addiction module antidote protein, partial [Boseongicola sp. SB0673_bin_14]|nr:HigA family addiction module antidote protein [Boseongicola sp. SB0667_bin_21]MYI69367.1 HigA family addiction module antidote protein [Boseongicola sp. SB0673_bin_14]